MEHIGIFGGTFNPPHMGHINVVRAAKDALGLDRVIVIPSGDPPHKTLPPDSPSADDRLEMTRLAFDNEDYAVISDIELRREGKSYTADTLWELREQYPGARLILIVGSDMFLSMHTWYMPEEIFSLCGVCVLMRDKSDEPALQDQADFLIERFGAECTIIQNKVIEISSTELRGRKARAEDYIPAAVMGYIRAKGLYGAV
jgi:nicotinate-nucleotide adenylyltransferase